MKFLVFCLAFFCALSSVFAQSYILDFELKKVYGNPYVFTDSSTQHTYFVFIRKETFLGKASLCIVETDEEFRILRQSETDCGTWAGSIVFQEINPTHLILYIVETNTIFRPVLAKLQIERKNLTYYFDNVAPLDMGDNFSFLRGLSDGKKHYVINVLRSSKADSLLVLKIENGVSQGVQRYLLPDVSDFNESWKSIFKDKFTLFGRSHPLVIINPTYNTNIAIGFSDNKLYLTNDKLVFTMKYGSEDAKKERIVRIDCAEKTITTDNIYFRKPKALEEYTSNKPTATASFITDNYLFQAWTNGEQGVLLAKSVDSLKDIRRWEFSEQDTFSFKNSPMYEYLKNEHYWFASKKKPFKTSKDLVNNMLDDGILLTARKENGAINVQFGTYKYVNEAAKRIAFSAALGVIGGAVGAAAFDANVTVIINPSAPTSIGGFFPDRERAIYFWMSLKGRNLEQPKEAILPNEFDVFCEKTKSIYSASIANYFSVNGRRAILFQRSETKLSENNKRYYVRIEEK
jgi:hypothetical protein